MAAKAGFGDNSTTFQRVATILAGGLKVEAGCWTYGTDATVWIPTTLTQVISLVCMTSGLTTAPSCVSNGFLTGTLSDSASGKLVNYIAVGW